MNLNSFMKNLFNNAHYEADSKIMWVVAENVNLNTCKTYKNTYTN